MPMPCFLSIEGQTQGKIDGGCTIKGHEGKILVQAVDHTIEIPKSMQTGLPTGKRVHGAMVITKEFDKATPKVFQALCSGEQLKNCKLEYVRISPQGKEELYYTVELQNAIITSTRTSVPLCLDVSNKTMGHMEEVAFTYETIIHRYEPDGIEAQDSWNAPKS